MGLSFAVPINVVTDVYEQIIKKGSVSRGWLGVIIQDVTRELAESFGMDIPGGALVSRLLPDTPAERSDLAVGDVIIKFNTHEVGRQKDLPPIVGTTKIGAKVPVEVIRAGKNKTLMVTIEELPENLSTAQNKSGDNLNKIEKNPLNIVVETPSQEEREQYQIEDYGVVVKSLEEGPASLAGIREGDVILLLDNEKVNNVEKFDRLIEKIPRNKSIPILIQRRGNPTFLALKLEDE
jgi:serine protease Do